MAFGQTRYNRYRKRSFTLSDSKRRNYAQQMNELEETFDNMDDWYLSSMKDSAYKSFDNYTVRLSNHSANNQYHDLENGSLLVNIKSSKLEFKRVIDIELEKILMIVNQLDLSKYRFINVINDNIHCFYKGFKTKKDIFSIRKWEEETMSGKEREIMMTLNEASQLLLTKGYNEAYNAFGRLNSLLKGSEVINLPIDTINHIRQIVNQYYRINEEYTKITQRFYGLGKRMSDIAQV